MAETKTTIKIPSDLIIFIDALLIQKGFKDIPDALRTQLREDIYVRLEQWLLNSMLTEVLDEESDNLEKFMESEPSPEKITKYFQSVVPNYEDVYSDALFSFKQTYLS